MSAAETQNVAAPAEEPQPQPNSADASSQATEAAKIDQGTSPKEEKPRQRRSRRRSGSRKNGAAEKGASKPAEKATKDAKGKEAKPRRRERPSQEQSENLTNVITIGTRLPMVQYVRIVKNVLNQDKHERLELHSFGN